MPKFNKDSLKLLRHQLGSVDIPDIKEEEMTEEERKEYCSTISAAYPRLEKDIKRFLHAQLLFMSNEAQTWEHVLFGRGTYNGISLLLEHWKTANDEHTSKGVPDDFDKNNPIGEMVG